MELSPEVGMRSAAGSGSSTFASVLRRSDGSQSDGLRLGMRTNNNWLYARSASQTQEGGATE
jgi:hypothetical protein